MVEMLRSKYQSVSITAVLYSSLSGGVCLLSGITCTVATQSGRKCGIARMPCHIGNALESRRQPA